MDYGKILKVARGISLYHNDSAETDIAPLNSTSAIVFAIPTAPSTRPLLKNSTNVDFNTHYLFRISIYTFLALMFATFLVIVMVRKVKKALYSSLQESGLPNYETVASEDSLNPQDNPGFEHRVNVDSLDAHRSLNRHNSEYDNYSDEDNTDNSKDKPPPYEDPPPYSSVSYEG